MSYLKFLNKFSNKFKLLILAGVPSTLFLIFVIFIAYEKYNIVEKQEQLVKFTKYLTKTNQLLHQVQIERGISILSNQRSGKKFQKQLTDQRLITDKKMGELKKSIKINSIISLPKDFKEIADVRNSIDNNEYTDEMVIDYYTDLISDLYHEFPKEKLTGGHLTESKELLVSLFLSINRGKESAGLLRAKVGSILLKKKLSNQNLTFIQELYVKRDSHLYFFKTIAPSWLNEVYERNLSGDSINKMNNILTQILKNKNLSKITITPEKWFSLATNYIEQLNKVENHITNYLMAKAKNQKSSARNTFFPFVAAMMSIIFLLAFLHQILLRNIIQLEEGLVRKADEANKANLAKDQFLAGMSHEIRTPLGPVISISEALKNTDLNADQKKYVDMLNKGGEQILSIINNILDLSKINAGQMNLNEEIFNLKKEISFVAEIMRHKVTKKNLKFFINIDEQIPEALIGDITRIRQIFLNLIGNAVKFTRAGSITVNVKLDSKSENMADLKLSVADTGIGIPNEKFEGIFQSFVQAESSTEKDYGGTGLGLPICRKIVSVMNGEIWVESSPGKGSTFFVTLPLQISQSNENTSAESNLLQLDDQEKTIQLENSLAKLNDKNILFVDDSDENHMIVELFLQNTGINVESVLSAEDALSKIFSGQNYDIILMDIEMPLMDGYEAVKEIRAWERENKLPSNNIIGFSAHALKGKVDLALNSGFTSYLTKPIKRCDLLEEVSRYLLTKEKIAV